MRIKGQEKELWGALFSRTRRRVLGLLFSEPHRTFYANEIVRSVAVGTGSVQRELTRLADAGLLSVQRIGNQVHYRANPDSLFFPELRAMVMKTRGVAVRMRRALDGAGGEIVLALLYGDGLREAGGGDPNLNLDLDLGLLVVSPDLSRAALEGAVVNAAGRVRLVLLRPDRFRSLREARDPELAQVLAGPHLVLAGCLDPP